jgi:hypothetical protein
MGLTTAMPAIEMPPSLLGGHISTASASEARLCLGKQFVDAAPVKADDDLVADDDGRSAAALVGPNQLLQRRGVFRDIALDKGDPFLRKILFRSMAGASTIGGVDFDLLFTHVTIPPFLHSAHVGAPWVHPCAFGAQFTIPPLPPGEGGMRARQSQGERLRSLDCHTLI